MVEPATSQGTAPKSRKGKRAKIRAAGESAIDRARASFEGLESNPVGVLVGGLAIGLVAGALVPRSEREKKALKPLGKRIAQGATAALVAARETGKDQLNAKLLSRDTAQDRVRTIFDNALQAAKAPPKKRARKSA